jgi:intracellular multiplication protein IcmD
MMKSFFKRLISKMHVLYITSIASLYTSAAFADSDKGIAGVANTLKSNFQALAQLITAGAYVAGFGFAVGAILKFKAHKDNPTQIPIGTPIALLFIAAALIFLPSLFEVAGETLFTDPKVGGTGGVDTIGGSK